VPDAVPPLLDVAENPLDADALPTLL